MESPVIKIKLFGNLCERLQLQEVEINAVEDTEALFAKLVELYPVLSELRFAIAVNQKIAHQKMMLDEHAEIALLPPFSGG